MEAHVCFRFSLLVFSAFALSLSGCNKGYEDRFGPFYVENDTTLFVNGDMGSRVSKQFQKVIEKYPNIRMVKFGECPGSRDDESLFEAAKILRNHNMNTHLPFDGVIESGAVDLFLSGIVRTREPGGKIGVHAWSSGNREATDYPVGHSSHQIYIDHYVFCGYPVADAEALYYFIINAAPADDIHFMSESEIDQFNLITP